MSEEMPHIPTSNGDLLDRFSILEIKGRLLAGTAELDFARKELLALEPFVHPLRSSASVNQKYLELLHLNERIWLAMDEIFELKETKGQSYYRAIEACIDLNVERAFLKREINVLSKSALVEAKSFFQNDDLR